MKKENKNFINKNRRKLLNAAGLAGAGVLISPLLSKAAPSTIIEAGSNVDTASYIIFKEGNIIYAKNGMTGKIDFQGSDAAIVIQSAFNNLPSNPYYPPYGGKIFIKGGTYSLTSGLNFSNQAFIIEGEGQGRTILYNNSSSSAIYSTQTFWSGIRDLQILGNNSTSGHGIEIDFTSNAIGCIDITNVKLFKNNVGIKLNGGVYNVLMSNCDIRLNRSHGVHFAKKLPELGNPNLNNMINCAVGENKGYGVYIETGHNQTFIGCQFAGHPEYGMYLNDSKNHIINCYSENNGKAGYFVNSLDNTFQTTAIYDTVPFEYGVLSGTTTYEPYTSHIFGRYYKIPEITTRVISGNGLQLPHIIRKIASSTVRNSHDAETSTALKTMTKLKTIQFSYGLLGSHRISFEMRADGINSASAELRKNGVLIGSIQQTASAMYEVKSQDISQTYNPNDTLELWVMCDGGLAIAYIKNFRVSYDDNPYVSVAARYT